MKEAMLLMDDKHIHSLLVYQDDRLVGIISASDYSKKVLASGLDEEATEVQRDVASCCSHFSPDATIMESMRVMAAHGFHHLPVEEGGKIVGMVSWSDIMHLMLN
jgi:CBS domain-containing protein